MYWTGNYQTVELNLTKSEAAKGSHSGQCDEDIAELRQISRIERQLKKINPDKLRQELQEYGAWNEDELSSNEDNLNRTLWIACGDIADGKG